MTNGFVKVKFKDKTEEIFAVDNLDNCYLDHEFIVIRMNSNNLKMINRDCVDTVSATTDGV